MARNIFSRLVKKFLRQRKNAKAASFGRSNVRLLVEQLEDRWMPSTNTLTFYPSNAVTQFSNASTNTFLGASFDKSASFGSIDSTIVGDFGAEADVSISGRAGLNLNFTGTGGTVGSVVNNQQVGPSINASLNQGFTQPNGFGQVVSFNPQNTNVAINSGSFSTTSPSFGYGADLVGALNGSVTGRFAVFSDFGGSFSFGGSEDIPLFSVNQNNNGEVTLMGYPIVGASPGLGLGGTLQSLAGGIEDFLANKALYFGISNDPPLRLKLNLSTPGNLQFQQDLQLQLGVPQQVGPYSVPKKLQGFTVSAGMNLGSMIEEAPSVALSTSALGAGGVLSSTGTSTIAQLSLEAGALGGMILGVPALGTTDTINLGPVSVAFTPISFQLQPTLSAQQTISIQPLSTLTYRFTDSHNVAMTPDVFVNGVDQGNVSSVTFVPGRDTVGIAFNGTPITVTPSWNFKEILTNAVYLNAALDATLTVGQISASIPGLGTFTAGPLFQQQFNFANTNIATLLNQTSTILDQTITTTSPNSPLHTFTIDGGGSFKLDTTVNATNDGNSATAGTLRYAVLSANALDSSTFTTIQLGAGTYNLTNSPTASTGTDGNLYVTASHLIIKGAGPGLTFIKGAPTFGDRLFHVATGADLTLEGLTLEDGNANGSKFAAGNGGAILQDSGSTLDVENCVITSNQAGAGGAIYTSDTQDYDHVSIAATPLTINNSTIRYNTATGQTGFPGTGQAGGAALGGGVYLSLTGVGSQALISNSTFAYNSAAGGAGGDGDPGDDFFQLAGNGGAGGNGEGGGLYYRSTFFLNAQGQLNGNNCILTNDTFTNNSAQGGAGGRGGDAGAANAFAGRAAGSGGAGGNGLGGAVRIFQVDDPAQGGGGSVVFLNNTIASNTASGGLGAPGGQQFTIQGPITQFARPGTNGANGFGQGGGVGRRADPADPTQAYSPPAFQNTILWNNSAGQGPDVFGRIISGGTNLIKNTADATISRYLGYPADLTGSGVDPKLGALGDNGGPTQTMAIAPGSAAIGAGQSVDNVWTGFPATDQRGFSRIGGGNVDIGAFQYQYDLAITGTQVFTTTNSSTVRYTFTVTNHGPDAATNVTLADPLPGHTSSALGLTNGWNSSTSNGTATFTDTSPLAAGQSATLTILVGLILTDRVNNTATVGSSTADTNLTNNQVTLTAATATEGLGLQNAVLYHFAAPGPNYRASNFTAAVNWGDGSPANNSTDGTGTVSVAADPAGGFDVLGSYVYRDVGYHAISVNVTSLIGGSASATFHNVTSQVTGNTTSNSAIIKGLSSSAGLQVGMAASGNGIPAGAAIQTIDSSTQVTLTAPCAATATGASLSFSGNTSISGPLSAPVPTPGGVVQNMALYHFVDPSSNYGPSQFGASITWGDSGMSFSPSNVTFSADPAGGFDVVGSHTFSSSVLGAVNQLNVLDVSNRNFYGVSLLHFDGRTPTASDTFTVNWGDGASSTTSGPSGGTDGLLIRPNINGSYDVIGRHQYTNNIGTYSGNLLVGVVDAPLTSSAVVTGNTMGSSKTVTGVSSTAGLQPGMIASGIGIPAGTTIDSVGSTQITLSQPCAATGTGIFITITDPSGIGTLGLKPPRVTIGQTITNALLYHFSDANPLATAADFTATVSWDNSASNTSADGSGRVTIQADPGGGFDVFGTHKYSSAEKDQTFDVSIADKDGQVTAASIGNFGVDYALTAGTLTLPNVTKEGDSISNALLFHFTDADTNGQASDFVATVVWGDGTSNTSADGSGAVTVSANASGGFDVFGTHGFGDVPSGSTFGVTVDDVAGASTGASSTSFSVADPSVIATGGISITASEGTDTGLKTLVHFGDPGGAEPLGHYSASIDWGDGFPATSGTISQIAGTFSVKGHHTYLADGNYTITVTINHDSAPAVSATASATVSDVAAIAKGGFSLNAVEGQSTGSQTVATFTDPGGPEALSAYSANINWGDTSSSGTIGYDKNHPFTVARMIPAGTGPSAVALADLGNGNLDLIVANTQDNDVEVFLGNGDGTFNSPAIYSLGTTSQMAGNTTKATATIMGLSSTAGLVAGMSALGSGIPAGTTIQSVDSSTQVTLSNACAATATGASITFTANSPTGLAIGDVSGDGKLDIVTVNSNTGTASILLNNGSNGFQLSGTALKTGANPSSVAIADLDGDKKNEIVVTNQGDNTLSIFLANANGAFQNATTLNTGASPSAVAIGNLGGNDRNDLAVAQAGSNTVGVFLNNGNGTFQTRQDLNVGTNPTAVAIGQLTSSGNYDLVTANAGSNNVSVLLGNGNGTFQNAVNYSTGTDTAPVDVLIQDAFGNGTQDIITANNGSNNVSVLAGNGNGTFQTAASYALSTGATAPTSIAIGDIGHAGVLDLVTANAISNDITVLYPPFAITGTHTYTNPTGATPETISVTVQHGGTTSNSATSSAAVADAKLTAGALTTPPAVTGAAFTNSTVFHFTDADPNATAADYTAVVSLGDGNSVTLTATQGTNGQIVVNPNGGFDVQLSYTYTTHGSMTFSVTVYDTSDGRLTSDPSDSTASASTSFIVKNIPTITWTSPSAITYGTALSSTQLDAGASVPGSFSYTPDVGSILGVGKQTLSVTFTPTDTTTYSSTTATVSLTVTLAHLTVTALDKSRHYGQTNPTLTYMITGYVNNENATSAVVTGTPVLNTSATPTSPVAGSPYAITVNVSAMSAANYDFTAVNGKLTVNKAHLTVTANNVTKIIGAVNPKLTATITGYVNGQNATTAGVTGSPALSTSATTSSPVGSYPIVVGPGTLKAANYDFAPLVPGTLSISYRIYTGLPSLVSWRPTFIIELTNASGINISSSAIPVTVIGIASTASPNIILPATSLGGANPTNQFRFSNGTYRYLLSTTGLKPGFYLLYFKAGNDPVRHALAFMA